MNPMNLFPDRVLFELTSPNTSHNLGLAQNALGCTRSIVLSQAAAFSGGFQLMAALRELGYSTIVANTRFVGSIYDIERILQGMYEEQVCDAITLYGFQTSQMTRQIQNINRNLMSQYPNYRVRILAAFPQDEIAYDAESVQLAINACKYLDGIVVSHRFFQDYDTENLLTCVYSPYSMGDVHSTSMNGKSNLVRFMRRHPHVIFAGSKILDSLTSFDVFGRFLEDNRLGSYVYE